MVFPAFSGQGGDLPRGGERGPGGDADEQALLDGGAAGELDGLAGVDVDDLVVDARVEDLGHEVGPDPLDTCAVPAGRRERMADSSGFTAIICTEGLRALST